MQLSKNPKLKIINYFKPYTNYFVLGLLSILLSSCTVLCIGFVIKNCVNSGIENLNNVFIYLFVAIISLSTSIYFRIHFITIAVESVINSIRRNLLSHLMNASMSFFTEKNLSKTTQSALNDLNSIQKTILISIPIALRNILNLVGGLLMMIYSSPTLTLYSSCIIPPVILIIKIQGQKTKKLGDIYRNNISSISSYIKEKIDSISTVKSFCLESFIRNEFINHTKHVYQNSLTYSKSRSILITIVVTLIISTISFVIFVGIKKVANNEISSASLVAFIFYSILSAGAINGLGDIFLELQQFYIAIERISEVMNIPCEKEEIIQLEKIHTIEFKNVSFSYKDKPIINNLSFKIKKGDTFAIVGTSGSGKSTILSLIMGFQKPKSGIIEINNIDMEKISKRSIRNNISSVLQDHRLFSDTISNNIALGSTNLEKTTNAVSLSMLKEFIGSLENGLEQKIIENGSNLSSGQRQRVLIARALFKKTDVLIMDEATSSIDTRNEHLIYQNIEKQNFDMKIIISHRIESIKNASNILVIHNGSLLEEGKHEDLLEKKGLYHSLFYYQQIKSN